MGIGHAGIGPHKGQQLGQVARRHGRMDEKRIGRGRHHGDGREIIQAIARRTIERWIHTKSRAVHQQRMAISGALHRLGADIAPSAAAIFHRNCVAQQGFQLHRQGAGDYISGTAGREGHNDAHGPFRPGGKGQAGCRQKRCTGDQGRAATQKMLGHVVLPIAKHPVA